ncbi:hypothetical protein OHA37_19750 [Streptomyces sp. NBC_00335]|uniref:hypothetical protein n=1 Tax=unclassified Streptomyces TaxID=2593676 RepID=UPI002252B235|nr:MULTISPECIES: hypothetical protein [unclassified Streptomyces]MCX5406111.1 hypothetical protein [Streptomyces sp. NBC_00086]
MRKVSRPAALLVLCATAATAALTGCAGPAREGYVAVGAAAPGPERGAGENVAPKAGVEFQSLPQAAPGSSAAAGAPSGSTSADIPSAGAPTGTPGGVPGSTQPDAPGTQPSGGSTPGGSGATDPGGSGNPPGTAPGTTPPTGPGANPGTPSSPPPKPAPSTPSRPPATPAKLSIGAPTRTATAERWCEQVTVAFTNTGGTAARSGTVSFATHIIGALGVDWATINSTQPLPAPIAGGTTKTQTYRICVESWRVPLGMRVETQKVTATWN